MGWIVYAILIQIEETGYWHRAVHYAHQARREFYNGVKYADAAELRTDFTLGIQGCNSYSLFRKFL
jgi:hypothetical protein